MKEKENLTIKKVKEILDDAYSILSKNYDIIDTVELNFKDGIGSTNKFIFYYGQDEVKTKLTLYLNPDKPNSVRLKYNKLNPILETLLYDTHIKSAIEALNNKNEDFLESVVFTLDQKDDKGNIIKFNTDRLRICIAIPMYKEMILDMLKMILDQMDNNGGSSYTAIEHIELCFGIKSVKLELHSRVNGYSSYKEFKLNM